MKNYKTPPFLLTTPEFSAISEICRDIAQVFFASLVVSPFLIGFDKIDWFIVISGGIATGAFWLASVWFARKGGK